MSERIVTVPDLEALDDPLPVPAKMILRRPAPPGEEQEEIEYYTAESWAKKDRDMMDKLEIAFMKPHGFMRWFWSYGFKAAFIGMGWLLMRRHARFSQTAFGHIPHGLQNDRDKIFEVLDERFNKASPTGVATKGFIFAFYDFLAIDNAYETVYWKIRDEIPERSKSETT